MAPAPRGLYREPRPLPVPHRTQHLHRRGLGPAPPVAGEVDSRLQDVLGGVAALRVEHQQRVAPFQQGGVPHVGVEQRRPLLEAGEAVQGPVDDAGHRQRVPEAVVPEGAEVRPPEDLRPSLEAQAVARHGGPGHLPAGVAAVDVHHDLPPFLDDVHVRRGDVHVGAGGRARRAGRREVRVGQVEDAGLVGRPGSLQGVGVGEPDVGAAVIGEVEVVAPQGVLRPVRHADERRPRDVAAHRGVHVGPDDGAVQEPLDADRLRGARPRRPDQRQGQEEQEGRAAPVPPHRSGTDGFADGCRRMRARTHDAYSVNSRASSIHSPCGASSR